MSRGKSKSHWNRNDEPNPTMIFWIILMLLFLVKFKGLAIKEAVKAIPKIRKKIEGNMSLRLNILININPITTAGYPIKQPMHKP